MSDMVISVAAMVIPVTAIILGYRRKMAKMQLDADMAMARDRAEAQRGDGRVTALEERVRVLERIVTDRGFGLAGEIEALRHEPVLERRQ
jgi:hypothetical protein